MARPWRGKPPASWWWNAGGLVASFKERQRLVQKPEFDALEKKYAVK